MRPDIYIVLRAERHVLVCRPVELLTSIPYVAVGLLDRLRCRRQDARHPIEPQRPVRARGLVRVRDQRFPQIEGDGFDHVFSVLSVISVVIITTEITEHTEIHYCNFTRPENPSSYP